MHQKFSAASANPGAVYHQNLLDLLICFQETTELIFISVWQNSKIQSKKQAKQFEQEQG